MRSAIQWMVGIGIGALFIFLSFREGQLDSLLAGSLHLDWSTGQLLSRENGDISWAVNLDAIAGYFACLVVIHGLRVWRWAPLLRPLVHVPAATLNRISAVGFMAVFLLPFRIGEAVRPWLLTREAPDVPFPSALATIVVERIADGLTVTALLFLSMLLLPEDFVLSRVVHVAGWSALAVFLTASVFIFLLHRSGEGFIQAVARLVGRIHTSGATRVERILLGFRAGLASLPEWRANLSFLAITCCYWSLNGLGLQILSRGFGLEFPPSLCFIMMACVVVGMMIPNSPGNVGTYWYFLLLPLSGSSELMSLPAVTAFGLTAYSMQLLQQSSFGLVFVLRGKVRWKTLQEATAADIPEEAGTQGTTAP